MENYMSTTNLSKLTTAPIKPDRSKAPHVSLIIPVFNEESSIEPFFNNTVNNLQDYAGKVEFIVVNDGSRDNTAEVILKVARRIPFVKLINFSRNFGKEAAVSAGIDYAEGDVVVPIDVDLQDPPEIILKMVEKWQEGFDIVFAHRESRKSESYLKRKSANLFYQIFNRISDIEIPDNVGDFRLMDRKVVNAVKELPERTRFMKGLFAWVGFSSTSISYERPNRSKGSSKWNYWKLWNFALDGLFSFSTVPLRVWSYFGALISLASFVYIGILVLRVLLYGIDVPGYASILTVILFLGGIQLLTIGIIGEYIGRIFLESKSRPIYIVESIYESSREVSIKESA
jgi:glycosyltransferase involved in cell wall biosynthesis